MCLLIVNYLISMGCRRINIMEFNKVCVSFSLVFVLLVGIFFSGLSVVMLVIMDVVVVKLCDSDDDSDVIKDVLFYFNFVF